MSRSELHRFPPKGPVNQAKAAAAVGKVAKGKKPKSQAVALKPADEKVRVQMEMEMELTQDQIVKMLEDLEESWKNVLLSKPPMWQELRKNRKKLKSSSASGDSKKVLTQLLHMYMYTCIIIP